MGKGDRKTKRGKIWRGTFGKSRPHKISRTYVTKKEVAAGKIINDSKEESKKETPKAKQTKTKTTKKTTKKTTEKTS